VKKPMPLQKLIFLFAACGLQLIAFSQYWQQKVDYIIDVTLNDKEKTLDAFEKIVYTNNSPDTLHFIWFHLWPNAYKNDKTAFSDQELELGNTDFYFSGKEEKGYINRLDFKVDGITAKTEDHPQHIDITKLVLPKPLAPGQQITITTPFHEKLPFNYSRGGYAGESFQITQWYPKPAVYDKIGWHPIPYLDQGEFYSEFGSFDVRITIPENYVVAATGELQTEQEKQWLKKKLAIDETIRKKNTTTQKKPVKTLHDPGPVVSIKTKTLQYKQDNIHDFAWFASTVFLVNNDTCRLPSGRIVEVYSFYSEHEENIWKNSLQYAKDALRFYSSEIGEYPYNVASVVQGPKSFGGGMEYPTITVISPISSAKDLDDVIAHELGHNWFYGVLATNERDHPWMDEGINTFYEYKYMQSKYARTRTNELLFQTVAARKKDQPINLGSEQFSLVNYEASVYHKTAEWMRLLENESGNDVFKTQMHNYFEQWKFKHPQPEDFKAEFQPVLGNRTEAIFSLLNTKGILPNNQLSGFKIVSPLIKGSIKAYLKNPTKNSLFISPSVGINGYDKFMVGGMISNYKLPPNHFQFLAIPMYGTASKKFTGLGKLNYTIMSDRAIRKTDIFLNASRFSMDEFKDTAGRSLIMQFQKLVPGIKFTFRQKDPKSTINKFIQWKTFFINEQSLRIIPDTVITGTDTTLFLRYLLPKENRYLNQLQFVYENYRGLYPFDVNLQLEQSKDFLRPTITANYFFSYKEGGLQLRLFAGKFIYTNGKSIRKQFENDRYFLNMTGPNGYEDYTYSDYFVGRNKFEGASSQQIMIRDGAFKVRTDLLASKVGKTDKWLAAANFSASIPKKLNPLSVLPVKIPLKLFADIGTYAEAWERNSDLDRFLFDAGFQIPLIDGAFNIYIPIAYNKVYKDYFKSTIPKNRLFKTISFSINFYTRSIKQVNRITEF
jgi:Peptidase family M1 domain